MYQFGNTVTIIIGNYRYFFKVISSITKKKKIKLYKIDLNNKKKKKIKIHGPISILSH